MYFLFLLLYLISSLYLQVFIPHKLATHGAKTTVILYVDGHKSHETLEAIELCIEHKIILDLLPPHTTHILQPLDVGYFKPFKAYWNAELRIAIGGEVYLIINKEKFIQILITVWQRTKHPVDKQGNLKHPDAGNACVAVINAFR